MILLTVKSYNGAPTDVAPASFDELGGTIGRADNNHLVLPDPERTISRVHAKVSYRADGYTIVDNGSNPISINGSPLGSGREHVLAAGDQVQIGGYVLVVSQGQGGKGGGAFDDLFSDVDDGLAAPAANPQHTRSVLHTWAPDPAVSRNGGSAGGLSPGQIPHDWDPFADEGGTGMQAPGGAGRAPMSDPLMAGASQSSRDFAAQAPSNLGRGGLGETAPAGADSLDHLFDLSAAPAGVDPLGGDVQQMQRMQPNMAGHADPLQALSRPAAYGAESFADLGSDLNMPMPMQRPAGAPAPAAAARSPLAPVATAAPPARPPAPAVGMPAGAVFSWDAPAAPPRPAFSPSAPLPGLAGLDAPDALGAPAAPASPAAPLPARPAPVATPARAAAPAAPMPNAGTATEAALLAALIEGLGVPELRLERLTPGLMLLIGQVLRESTRGAVELLMARTELKREMRAELTMIVARENNPLKFSPSVDVALQHLLGPPATGFMPAAPAVRDAFDDLRAHQLGVMAGMKAALDGVLQRFDPAVLQGKLTRKSAIDSLLPSGRKARLWELFQELYGQISAEALDDFDELFGRAFLRAYEAQLDALAEQRTRR